MAVAALFGGDWRRAGGEEKSMGEGASEMVTREGKPSQLESEPYHSIMLGCEEPLNLAWISFPGCLRRDCLPRSSND